MQQHTHVMATRRPLASLSCHLMHMHMHMDMHHMQCARDNCTHAAQLRPPLIDATDLLLERQPCKAAQANQCALQRAAHRVDRSQRTKCNLEVTHKVG